VLFVAKQRPGSLSNPNAALFVPSAITPALTTRVARHAAPVHGCCALRAQRAARLHSANDGSEPWFDNGVGCGRIVCGRQHASIARRGPMTRTTMPDVCMSLDTEKPISVPFHPSTSPSLSLPCQTTRIARHAAPTQGCCALRSQRAAHLHGVNDKGEPPVLTVGIVA
ncbi:hypothetical protein FRC09_004176, partial [Ceratobasidium sp. 395]